MVSIRKAKKAAARVHWKRVFPPKRPEASNRFILPCQEMLLCEADRKSDGTTIPPQIRPRRPSLLWILRGSGPTLLIGGLGMIRPAFFPLVVIMVYSGIAIIAVDLYLEGRLQWIVKILGWAILLSFAIWFTFSIAWVTALFTPSTLSTRFNFPENKGPGGIKWKPFYTEVDLILSNPTDENYDEVNILVKPDKPLAAISHYDDLAGVSFEDAFGMNTHLTIDDSSQPGNQLTMVFLATDAGYKVQCDRVPPRRSLKIVMAVVNINPTRERKVSDPAPSIPPDVKTEDFYVTYTLANKDGKFTYWYGNENQSAIYLLNSEPHRIDVTGTFIAANRKRTIELHPTVQEWEH